jgi:hypothetical protein
VSSVRPYEYSTNEALVAKSKTPHRRILSKAAKRQINAAHKAGKFDDRKDKLEPPYMAPSSNPMLYSSVRDLDPSPLII